MSREDDERDERLSKEFLYDNFLKDLKCDVEVVTDKKLQKNGADLIITDQHGPHTVDLKNTTHLLSEDMYKTYHSELIRNGFDGWLPFGHTDILSFCDTFAKGKHLYSKDDIYFMLAMQISKKNYIDAIEKETGYSLNELVQMGYDLIDRVDRNIDDIMAHYKDRATREMLRIRLTDNVWIKYSPHLSEKPVNIVSMRSFLEPLTELVDPKIGISGGLYVVTPKKNFKADTFLRDEKNKDAKDKAKEYLGL